MTIEQIINEYSGDLDAMAKMLSKYVQERENELIDELVNLIHYLPKSEIEEELKKLKLP